MLGKRSKPIHHFFSFGGLAETRRLTINAPPAKLTFVTPKEQDPEPKTATNDREEKPEKELSAEEQMERYEEALKETDWGHQPC
jgi:hypothetical protein